jgi:hypothetical protein
MMDTPDWTDTVGRQTYVDTLGNAPGEHNTVTFDIDTDTRVVVLIEAAGGAPITGVSVTGNLPGGGTIAYFAPAPSSPFDFPAYIPVNHAISPTVTVQFLAPVGPRIAVVIDSSMVASLVCAPGIQVIRGATSHGTPDQWNVTVQGDPRGERLPAYVYPGPDGTNKANTPAISTLATVTFPAAVGFRWSVQSIDGSMVANAAGAGGFASLIVRDGASGVGPVIWGTHLAVGALQYDHDRYSGSPVVRGSVGAAMTVEFSSMLANVYERVSASAFTVV